jgi:hypothetical protein
MGYTHDTEFAQFIAPNQIIRTAGAWTDMLVANVVRSDRATGVGNFTLFVPVLVPSNAGPLKGARLKSIELHYKIATAAGTAFSVEVEKVSINAAGVVSGVAVPVTMDAGHTTDGQRRAAGDHRMVASLNEPAWVDNDEVYWLSAAVSAAATTAFSLFGALANFDWRV